MNEKNKNGIYNIIVFIVSAFLSAIIVSVFLQGAGIPSGRIYYFLLWIILFLLSYNIFVFSLSLLLGKNKSYVERKKQQIKKIRLFFKKKTSH